MASLPPCPPGVEVPVVRQHHRHRVRAARRRVQRRDQPVGARERQAVLLTADAQLVRRLVHRQHVHQGDAAGLGGAGQLPQRSGFEARTHGQHVGVGGGSASAANDSSQRRPFAGVDATRIPAAARSVEERVGPGGGAVRGRSWKRLVRTPLAHAGTPVKNA
jgi:hypothetical protein